jgi:hypothetical protein
MNGLDLIDVYDGTIAITVTMIMIILFLNSIVKYYKYKVINLIFIGIAILGLSARYWPRIVTLISILITKNAISTELYFILGYGHSIGLISWMIGWILTVEMKKSLKKLIMGAFFCFEIVYLLFFYIFIFFNQSLIGTYNPVFEDKSGPLILLHTVVMICLLIITISRVYLDTRKTNVKEIRLKGDFIFFGMLFLFVGTIFNLFFKSELLYSIFLIIAVLSIYIGFTIPKWIKNLLI